MSGDFLSMRMIDAEIKEMRKEDRKYFKDADEFHKELEKLKNE